MPDEDTQPSLEPPKLFGRRKRDVPPDSDPELGDEPTAAIPAPAPEPAPTSRRAPIPDDFSTAREDPPVARTVATGAPLFVDEVPEEPQDQQQDQLDQRVEDLYPVGTAEREEIVEREETDEEREGRAAERRPKSRRVPRGPVLTGYPASALTGLLVGLLMVGLTVASLRACEGIRGTATCGGPGLLLLVIILVLLVLVGQVLLKLLRVPDPGSTSFLAVGLIAVVALLFLIDVILNWQMVIVIPLVGMVSFLISHWVTTAFVETDA